MPPQHSSRLDGTDKRPRHRRDHIDHKLSQKETSQRRQAEGSELRQPQEDMDQSTDAHVLHPKVASAGR